MNTELKAKIDALRARAEHVRECAQRADRTEDYRREMAQADALFAQLAELEKEIAA